MNSKNIDFEKLKWDKKKHFETDEEVFRFLGDAWNISGLKRYIESEKISSVKINPNDLQQLLAVVKVDEEYALQSKNVEPGILVERLPGEYILVDGYHRLYRTLENEGKTFEVFVVPFGVQVQYLMTEQLFKDCIKLAKRKAIS